MENPSEDIVARALHESERPYRQVAERSPNGIMVHIAGRVAFANAACVRIFGARSADDLIGREFASAVHPDCREAVLGRLAHAGAGAGAASFVEARLVRLDGSAFDAEVASATFFYEGLEATETTIHEVAARGPRAAARALAAADAPDPIALDEPRRTAALVEPAEPDAVRRAAEPAAPTAPDRALEARLSEITAERDEALRASELKSRFLAAVSDEIRTPMNGIMGMTDLLLDTCLDDVQRDCAETIRSSADALLAIMSDILDYSKIEAGRLRVDSIDFDLRTAVEHVVGPFREKASAKGLEFVCLVQPDVPETMQGDPGRLRQVLANLVANAVKFTDAGEVTVRVGVAEESADRVSVRFSVADTGIGIPGEAQDRIFLPFSQGKYPITGRHGGTGLGLAICRGLVDLMGGEIDVESEAGRGSTFTVVVPSAKRPAPRGAAPRSGGVEGLRALVLCDADATRCGLTELFSAWGMKVTTAEGVGAAIDALRAADERGEPFEIAMINFVQAESDPLALGRAIVREFGPKAPPLLLIAPVAHPGDGARALEAGFGALLTKPIAPAVLRDGIAAIAGARRPTAGASAPALVTRHTLAEERARRRARILVVEDDAVSQKVAVRLLERLGHRADVAADGSEAVAAVQRIAYDVVLMDCRMPVMDGFEASKAIRSLEGAASRVPIIALTADAMQAAEERCHEAAMNGYLTKPLRPEPLAEALARWLPEPEPDEGDDESDEPAAKTRAFSRVTLHAPRTEPETEPTPDAPILDTSDTAG